MQGINVIPGVPSTPAALIRLLGESDPIFPDRNLQISGTTRDASGNALAGCSLILFDSFENTVADSTVSDANGNYILRLPVGLSQTQTKTWKILAYLAGSPDVAGATVNTLQGS